MKTAIILFPGTNRENDMAMAIERHTGSKPAIIWHKETDIGQPDLIVLPGGFSYGDYLRCGAMAAHSPVMREVIDRANKGTRVLGVCNGFQMLVETGLVPGALLRNRTLKFICRQTHLRCENADTDFTRAIRYGDVLKVPVAHGEGNYFASDDLIDEMNQNNGIAFKYCDPDGYITDESNKNGSLNNIAGVFNKKKNVLGMMPHPENAVAEWQGGRQGSGIFESLFASVA